MDEIRIQVGADDTIEVLINGRNFLDRVREVEQPYADREGHPDIAGSYSGLKSELVLAPSRHWLDPGIVEIYGCGGCRELGCWPLMATITLGEGSVIWSDFHQPHRRSDPFNAETDWSYAGLGPFTFRRSEYERRLQELSE